MAIRWRTRKFFCDDADCSRRVFVERLPNVADFYARRISRLELASRAVALACGGGLGARLAHRLGMPTNGNALLRLVRRSAVATDVAPRAIGVDDWAYRRGHRYGTLICDLETRRPIELLSNRDAESLHSWLRQHPTISVVARDRGECYVQATTTGAPQAVQVADRWHLLRNVSDALKKLVDRHPGQVVEAWRANVPSKVAPDTAREVVISPSSTSAETPDIYPDERGRLLYEQVHVRLRQGESQRSIARQLGIHRETVQRFAQAGSFPERAVRSVRTPLDAFRELLWQRWRGGLRNARRLHHELVVAGFKGSYYMVLRCVRGWRRLSAGHGTTPDKQQPLTRRPSARTVAWWLTRAREALSVEESSFLVKLEELCPDVAAARHLAHRFTDLPRNRRSEQLNAWLAEAAAATSPLDLRRFASGLQSD